MKQCRVARSAVPSTLFLVLSALFLVLCTLLASDWNSPNRSLGIRSDPTYKSATSQVVARLPRTTVVNRLDLESRQARTPGVHSFPRLDLNASPICGLGY